jgi:hypothetical protein
MTRCRLLALVAVLIVFAWYLATTIRVGGVVVGLAVVVLPMTVGIWVVERLERRP